MTFTSDAPVKASIPTRNPVYRDEMNFAEFPLASVSDVVAGGQKTLVFGDTIVDQSTNQKVERKLTITGSDEYGLPTPLDDQVILGLVQLTAKRGFAKRKVHFSRRELIRELGWRDESKSYERVKESLNRWIGVTLYYEKAWWSKEDESWVDESFHILEQVTIFDRDRIARRQKTLPDDPNSGLSSFVWNGVVFDSFQAGYIKQLDFELYKRFASPIAKRMFRFLDKRFHRQAHLEFELCHFAFEKLGLSRNYHAGEIKRKLGPAIAELEEHGVIEKMASSERFRKEGPGVWRIRFTRAGRREKPSISPHDEGLLAALTARGVSAKVAEGLVREFPKDRIEGKLRFFDWLSTRKDTRVARSPAGFLVEAIRRDFPPPRDFVDGTKPPASKETPRKEAERIDPEAVRDEARQAKIDAFWEALTAEQQVEFEREAVAATDGFLHHRYREGQKRKGPLFEATRKAILHREITRRLPSNDDA